MKLKKKGKCTREEMAQYLTRLAGMVADGVLDFEQVTESIGNDIHFSLEMKRKKEGLEIGLLIKARGVKTETKGSFSIHTKGPVGRKAEKSSRPYRAKQIKKALGSVWRTFKRLKKAEATPIDERDIERIQELMDAYEDFVDDSWEVQWVECRNRVLDAISAYRDGEMDRCLRLIQEVDDMTRVCHKVYK